MNKFRVVIKLKYYQPISSNVAAYSSLLRRKVYVLLTQRLCIYINYDCQEIAIKKAPSNLTNCQSRYW